MTDRECGTQIGDLGMSLSMDVLSSPSAAHLKSFKSRLLGGTALAACAFALAWPANANDLTSNGVTVPSNSATGLWYVPVGGTTVANVNTANVNAGFLNGIWILQAGLAGTQNITVGSGLSVTGNTAILATATNDTINIVNNGTITSTVLDGIYASNALSGDITVTGPGKIDASAGRNGMWLLTPGAVNVGTAAGPIGAVTAGLNGIVINSATGPVNINATSITGTAGYGIWTVGGTGNQTISTSGAVSGGINGLYLNSTTGNISADGKGTSTLTGKALEGVGIFSGTGNLAVTNYAAIDGARAGIWAITAGSGSINVQGNGPITGKGTWGVLATAAGGDVNVGSTKTNGAITGATIGLQATTALNGNVNVTTDKDVTGNINWGILTTAQDGTTTVNVKAGTVSGGSRGLESTSTTGNINNTVAAGATVQGSDYGYLTATTTGLATTTNAGTIKSTGDTGAAGTNGGNAIWAWAGNNVINNTGQIIGSVHSGSTSFVLNNQAGGVWTPGANTVSNLFAGANDTVNNAGTINIRAGSTTFAGLENFNNQSGGLVNMTYNSAATDNLTVLNMSSKAGSTYAFNFDANAANNSALGFDNSSNGKGTADTIVVTGSSTPQGKATVNIVASGKPTALTGSVALIYTGVNLVAPTAGATIKSSANYTFGAGNPSGGATAYYLVDDGKGGLYLQWAPNTSAAALSGFGGAVGGGSGSSSASAAAGSALASASAGSTGLGGVGIGGGPTGGGALGQIGDMAASSVSATDSSVQVGNGERSTFCRQKQTIQAWGQVEGERSTFSGGRAGQTESLAGGLEVDAGQQAGLGCNRLGFGVFSFAGGSRSAWDTGSSNSENTGLGTYLRATSAAGFYATALGAFSWNEAKLSNAVYASSANKSSHGVMAAGAVGYLAKLGASVALDTRGFATYSKDRGNGFTDTAGITVSETRDNVTTYGISLGLHQAFNQNLQGFVRAGIKKSELDSMVSAYGNAATGTISGVATSLEAGLNGNLRNGVTLGASAFTTFSESARGYGGRAQVGVKF
jgi:hypothetical protein